MKGGGKLRNGKNASSLLHGGDRRNRRSLLRKGDRKRRPPSCQARERLLSYPAATEESVEGGEGSREGGFVGSGAQRAARFSGLTHSRVREKKSLMIAKRE